MATLEDLVVHVGADVDDAEKNVGGLQGAIDKHFGKITAAGVAAGAGLEAFARKVAPLNEANSQLAAMTGESSDAMRELTLETSNVTFPLDEAQSLMQTASQRGVEGKDALQEYAQFWDMVGDATGEAGPELGQAAVALESVGISAGQEGEALAALGFITESTTGSVGEFLDFVERAGPELSTMGADVDDAAAIMGVLEKEMGLTGRVARTEFNEAINESDGSLDGLLSQLGISEDQFASYKDQVAESSDVIQRNADIHADSFTPLQKLQHAAEEMMFKYGGLANAAGALALPLMALGPLAKGASLAFTALTGSVVRSTVAFIGKTAALVAGKVAMAAVTVAQWLWNAAMMANPIGLIILLIIGLIAVIVLIVKNWDTVKAVTLAVWGAIWNFLKAVGRWIANVFWENGIKRYFQLIGAIINWLKDRFMIGFNRVKNFISDLLDRIRQIPGKIKSGFAKIGDFISAPFRAGFDAVRNFWNNTIGGKGFDIPSWVPGVGGKSFRFPSFHTGGIVPGPAGNEVAILAQGGEGVFTPEQMAALEPRGGDGAAQIPDEFVAVAPIDLGEGIRQVVDIKLERRDRGTVRRTGAGAGTAI